MSKPTVRYRSAKTGRWVSKEYAKANPDTTVREETRGDTAISTATNAPT